MARNPSYQQGFAPRDFVPRYPSLWRGLVYAYGLGLGPTGSTLRDWGGKQAHGTLTGFTLDTAWAVDQGRWTIKGVSNSTYVNLGSITWSEEILTIASWASRPNWASARYGQQVDGSLASTSGYGLSYTGGAFSDWTTNNLLMCGDGYSSGRNPRAIGGDISGFAAYSWHHLGGSIGPAHHEVYLDGRDVTTGGGNASFVSGTFTTRLFSDTSAGNYHDGGLDDVLFYNRRLSAQEWALLASRRGVLFEPRFPRKKPAAATTNRRRRVICGSAG